MAKKENKEKEPIYQVTLTESQLKLINRAVEGYFRLHMGQFFDFVSDIAYNGESYSADDPNHNMLFNAYIARRDEAERMFNEAFRKAHPSVQTKTTELQRLIDMWSQVRHFLWTEHPTKQLGVDSYPPFIISGDKPISIDKVTK